MNLQSIDDIKVKIPELLQEVPYLKLLVLFGSRATGSHQKDSDWDFALLFDEELRQQYEPGGGWNCYRSWMILQRLLDLGDEEMDWVDLKDASEILAHSIARDGLVLYEKSPGCFEAFQHVALKSQAELKLYRQSVRAKVQDALTRWRA
jgi:predicted nucleotidyltransferase